MLKKRNVEISHTSCETESMVCKRISHFFKVMLRAGERFWDQWRGVCLYSLERRHLDERLAEQQGPQLVLQRRRGQQETVLVVEWDRVIDDHLPPAALQSHVAQTFHLSLIVLVNFQKWSHHAHCSFRQLMHGRSNLGSS